jgi:aspartyl-tRNA(Asn)/glutamyl-tRNA(Gln) amidotransferase subunit A
MACGEGDAMDRRASGGPVPPDPLGGIGIAEFGAALRAGRTSAEAATRAYLARIAAAGPRIGCFLHVAQDAALASARAMDALLRAGTDLGPLMGVPVAVKDLFFVDGMPTRAGSDIDVSDLVGTEAGMVRRLRRLGAVIIGKARQSEFAFAANLRKDAPWNPWDARTKRMAGTSSGGSAVAMASRFAAFTLGSDAGGSVRQPAALNGVVGYKATVGFLPTDGALALSSTFDSIGTFHACVADAALALSALRDEPPIAPRAPRGLRLGLDRRFALDTASPGVAARFAAALDALQREGVELVPMSTPGVDEIPRMAGQLVPAEMVAFYGAERLRANRDLIDPVAWERIVPGLEASAHDYLRLVALHRELVRRGVAAMEGLDGWVMPTVPEFPQPVADFPTVERVHWWNGRVNDATRLANYLGQCGISLPLPADEPGALPAGLQLVCAPGADRPLLAIAMAVESVIGPGDAPDLSGFC